MHSFSSDTSESSSLVNIPVTSATVKPEHDATSVTTLGTSTNNQRDIESNRIIEASWNQAEEELLQQQVRDQMSEQLYEQKHPSRRMLHKMSVLLSIVTCIAALLMLIGQIMGLFIFRSYGPVQYVFHFYVFLLCIIVVLVECELTPVGQQSFIFSYWLTRGLSYSFIGVLGLEENDTADWTKPSKLIENFVKVVAWFMIGVGAIYFMLGLLCIQIIYTKERKDYVERCTLAKQLRNSRTAMHPTSAAIIDPVPSSLRSTIPSEPDAK